LGLISRTIEHLQARFAEEGIEAALERRASQQTTRAILRGRFDPRLMTLPFRSRCLAGLGERCVGEIGFGVTRRMPRRQK